MPKAQNTILITSAKLGLISKVTTIIVWSICIYCIILIMNWKVSIEYKVIPSLLFLLFFVPIFLKPTSFLILRNGLLIKRPIMSKFIKFDEIEKIDKIEPNLVSITRVFLNTDGVCGFLGFVKLKGIGLAWSYLTDKNKIILIQVKHGKRYLISPQNFERFFEELQSRIYDT